MSVGETLLSAYGAATGLLTPASGLLLRGRLRRGKEDPERIGERSGQPGRARPEGPVAWLHGASVGESLAVLPLVERLAARGFFVVLTTGTVSSARLLAPRLPPGAVHQFVPLDLAPFMRRFLDHWRPALVMLAESELWPNLMAAVARRAIPLVLVNARLSARSYARWRRARPLIGAMLGRTALCLAQTAADAERFGRLGAARVEVTGHLKFDAPAPSAEPARVAEFMSWLGDRFRAARSAVRPWPIGPRRSACRCSADPTIRCCGPARPFTWPTRWARWACSTGSPRWCSWASRWAGAAAARTRSNRPSSATPFCTYVGNFTDIYHGLDEAGGAVSLADGAALADALAVLLADRLRRDAMKRAAGRFAASQGGATDRVMAAIAPFCRTVLTREPAH